MATTEQLSPKCPTTRELLTEIRDSDEFKEGMGAPRANLINAFSSAALALADLETRASGIRTPEGHFYALLGQINGAVESQRALDGYLNQKQKDFHKDRMIEFNHELRDMIDAHQHLNPVEVRRILTEGYIALNRANFSSKEQAQLEVLAADKTIDAIMCGMWHEVNGELIAGMAGYAVDSDVSIDDEKRGVDAWIHMRPQFGDDGWMYADFKSTPEKAKEANRLHPDNNAVWSQLRNGDYRKARSFRISPNLAKTKSNGMKNDLETLYRWYTR